MGRSELIERILFAVDGYRFGEWPLGESAARITRLIEEANRQPAELIDSVEARDI